MNIVEQIHNRQIPFTPTNKGKPTKWAAWCCAWTVWPGTESNSHPAPLLQSGREGMHANPALHMCILYKLAMILMYAQVEACSSFT